MALLVEYCNSGLHQFCLGAHNFWFLRRSGLLAQYSHTAKNKDQNHQWTKCFHPTLAVFRVSFLGLRSFQTPTTETQSTQRLHRGSQKSASSNFTMLRQTLQHPSFQ